MSEADNGVYDGMNKGIMHARGRYLNFMNSGDRLNNKSTLSEIDFDGTGYIYGDAIIKNQGQTEVFVSPPIIDFMFIASKMLNHQSCFIARSLFEGHTYDTSYRIVADWIHLAGCALLQNTTFKHVPLVVAVCEKPGISADNRLVLKERLRWAEDNIPPFYRQAFIICGMLSDSPLKEIIMLPDQSASFKRKAAKAAKLIYRLSKAFKSFKSMAAHCKSAK